MKTATLTIILLALSLAALTGRAASAEGLECAAMVIDVITAGEGVAEPDVYFAPTDGVDITVESTFAVYRPNEVNDPPVRHYPLMLYVGRLQVVDIQDEVVVGRMIELASGEEYPRVRYPTVMIGDCLRLEAVAEEPLTVSADALPAETLDIDGLKLGKAQAPKPSRVIPTKVLFEFDKSIVRDVYADDLARLAGYITEEKPARVVIEGHADWIGTEEYNVGLSERRARAIVDYLVTRHGVDRALFAVRAYGESRPEATNETAEGRQKNRRAATALFFKVVPTSVESGAQPDRSLLIRPDELEPDGAEIPRIPIALSEIDENPEDF
jgi:outer membrane protein OmpA-like peptidoglycan-associated protein